MNAKKKVAKEKRMERDRKEYQCCKPTEKSMKRRAAQIKRLIKLRRARKLFEEMM